MKSARGWNTASSRPRAGPRPCSLVRWAWRPGATSRRRLAGGGVLPAGDGRVTSGWPKTGVPPDFHADRPFRYIHRRIGEADVYFVANGSAEDCATVCTFRVAGKQPELWHPETGSVMPLMAYEKKTAARACRCGWGRRNRCSSSSAARPMLAASCPCGRLLTQRTAAEPAVTAPLRSHARTRSGSRPLCVEDGRRPKPRGRCPRLGPAAGDRAVRGRSPSTRSGAGPAKVTFEKLEDWSKRAEEGIKYYSGTATYRDDLQRRRRGAEAPHARWYLDLGKVAVMAEVRLNGKDLGIVWKPPYRVDVTEAVEAGRQRPGSQSRQPLDQSPDRRRATPGRLRPQPQRHAEELAEVAAGGQAQPDRPLHVQFLEALEEGRPAAGIRPAGPGDAAPGDAD